MKIAILGASGYIGQNLINYLLTNTDYTILALSTNAEGIKIENKKLIKTNVDIFDTNNLRKYLSDCDVAFYLIHMMGKGFEEFEKAETKAAISFCTAIKNSKIKRVIYLGGLGKDTDKLSLHLLSRHKTGEIIRKNCPKSIEFRASMIMGKGSVSYDIITNIVNKMPILILPKWFKTLTQPIGLDYALKYLTQAITVKINHSEIIEIGGPNKLSYIELMKSYAKWKNKKLFIITLPIIPHFVSSWWLSFFVSNLEAKIVVQMFKSLANSMLVSNNKALILFPKIKPKPVEQSFV
jgi:uncharacterized protein YbjT (DUF2867 family)